MSMELLPTHGSDNGQTAATQKSLEEINGSREGTEDTEIEETPRSELPPSFNVMTPGTSEALARESLSAAAGHDYFTPQPASSTTVSVPTHELHARGPHSPSASISATDATATGHILPTDATSLLHSSGRPTPHTTISSLSIESTESAATVIPERSERRAFPNQALSALHSQYYPPSRPHHDRRGTQPHQISTFASAIASLHSSGVRTAQNSPAIGSHPALYSSTGPPSAPAPESSDGSGTYASPFLHFTHTHVPKETHVADVDVDPVSGRKLINHYEIIDELGRGTHGKVKLGRVLDSPSNNPTYVAIKIVERYSKRRKLGRLGTTEDKVKKEVAILKKARHPNVVALLEVIDDPTRKKVYIVLEWVERGEINWRVKGPKEIAMVEARRYEREKKGSLSERAIAEDLAVTTEAQKRLAKQRRRQIREYRLARRGTVDIPEAWSIEMAGETESEESEEDRLSRISSITAHSESGKLTIEQGGRRPSRTPSPLYPSDHGESSYISLTGEPDTMSPSTAEMDLRETRRASSAFSASALEGTMYGPYDPLTSQTSRVASLNSLASARGSTESYTRHATEILDSFLDSELEYVPVMALDQIRVAFRDTLLGLQYLHFQGIIHRDIKPPNLLATIDNRVKISDFGVSYLGRPVGDGEQEDVSEAEAQDHDEAKELAKTVGTPAFYAPELCITDPTDDPLPVTKAIDVWALGVTLFCMLFARTPFVDTEYVVMRQIADEEIYIPWKRLQPVDNRPKSRPSSHNRTFHSLPSDRRNELDLVYEDISDELHDLLERLLIKDPRKRITLEEVRHHPWVLSDIPNKVKWLEETDPGRQAEGKKIEISNEELNTAVVPLNLVERMRSGLKKVLDRTGLTRTRGQSNAGSSSTTPKDASPSHSNTPTAGLVRDDRRRSMRSDEALFSALKASQHRDGEHPLSRSLAASPDTEVPPFKYSPSDPKGHVESLAELTRTVSRPDPPHRANTIASTAGSMRTVKQSDYRTGDSPPSSPGLTGTPQSQSHGARGLNGLLGGTSNLIKTVRDRSSQRGKELRGSSSERGSVGSADVHGEATLALSQATAAGHVHTPDSLRDYTPNVSTHDSPASSRPHSLMSDSQTLPQQQYHLQPSERGTLSRLSSSSSIASVGRRMGSVFRTNSKSRQLAPESSAEDWKRADEERVRRRVRESREEEDRARSSPSNNLFSSPEPFGARACPESPDDLRAKQIDSRVPSISASSNAGTPSEGISPVNRTGSLPPALVSSTSDLGSAVSMSISNPSIPSVISEASSIDADDGAYEYFREEKREPSSDDTINPESHSPLDEAEQVEEGYTPDQETALDSEQDDEFDSSSDSDGGLVMRRKSAGKQGGHGLVVSGDSLKDRRGTGVSTRSKKSSRSGSNNTMKKVRTRESCEERRSEDISEE